MHLNRFCFFFFCHYLLNLITNTFVSANSRSSMNDKSSSIRMIIHFKCTPYFILLYFLTFSVNQFHRMEFFRSIPNHVHVFRLRTYTKNKKRDTMLIFRRVDAYPVIRSPGNCQKETRQFDECIKCHRKCCCFSVYTNVI